MRTLSLLACAGWLGLGAAASAQVTSIGVSAFSGNEEVLDFEAGADDAPVMGQFSGLGVVFDSSTGGWLFEDHSDYSDPFATAAANAGAGVRGLVHLNQEEEILFPEPVIRVGFQFGANVGVRVPVTLFRGATQIGSLDLIVGSDQMPFFGFESLDGIDKVAFADELLGPPFYSQLDNLRFETEATARGKGAKAGKALVTPPVAKPGAGSFECRVTNAGTGDVTVRLSILDANGVPLAVEDRTVPPDAFGSVGTGASNATGASCKASLVGKGNTKTLRSSLTVSDGGGVPLSTIDGR